MGDIKPSPDLSKLSIAPERRAISQSLMSPVYKRALIIISGVLALWILFSVGSIFRPAYYSDKAPPLNPQISQNSSAAMLPSFIPAPEVLNASGYVVAQRQAAVASKATGRLKELNVVEGDLVKKDDILAVLENQDLAAMVNETEANVNALSAKVRWAEASYEDARREFERAQDLRKQRVVSISEFDRTDALLKKAVSELDSARANLLLAQAQLEKSRVELSYTTIRAPFDGTVLTKNADIGEIVAPFGNSSDARAAVVSIADMSSLQVEADVSEANISKVFIGQECEITLDSFPGKTYKGFVTKIVPTVDRAKATVMTKIEFSDRDEHVLPEMSAKVAFKIKQ